jgi:hypothetical protein
MAAYNTITKILVVDSRDDRADSVSGSSAKTINDYIQTLDSTTNQIISINTSPLTSQLTRVQIVHLG